MAQRDNDPPQRRRWLEGVHVDFVGARPKTSLKLVVSVGETLSSCKVEEKDAVRWKGKLACSETSMCSVKLYKKVFSSIPKLLTYVETPMERVNDSSAQVSLQDVKKKITIRLTFSEIAGRRQQEFQSAASSSDSVDNPSKRSHGSDDVAVKARRTRKDVNNAKAAADRQKVILDKLGRARSLIDAIKAVGTAVGNIYPAIGAAASALGWLIKACEKQEACRDEAKKLMKELDDFLAIEKYIEELKEREETRLAVERMLDLIAQISDYVREHASNNRILGNLLSGKYKKTLEEFGEEFASAKESFDRSIRSEVFRIVHDIEQELQLQKLRSVDEAYYKSGLGHTCLPDTRVVPLDGYLRWMHGSGPEAKLSWLYGPAGTGKTCMANTVAQAVHDSGFGLSCFFFKRDDPNLSKPERVFPTLASRFAERYASYRAALLDFLRRDHLEATQSDISKQFDLLFVKPLAKTADPFQTHIVVIDALDECGTAQEQKVLAECLLKLAKATPWIKVFVTSRAEPAICTVFESSPDCFAEDLRAAEQTDADLRQYIVTKLGELEVSLQDDQIARLAKQAAGLFIWCTTLFSYLTASTDPQYELESFLENDSHDSLDSHQKLYELYDIVIESAFENRDIPFVRTVLSIVYVTATLRPLSISGIAHFVRCHRLHERRGKAGVENVIRALHAVLYEDKQSHDAVRVHHASFLDFLHNKLEREDGWERPKEAHAFMSRSCLATMDRELRFNICKLDGAPVLNQDIPNLGARITDFISQELQYAVELWLDHLSRSGSMTDDDLSVVTRLLSTTKVLFWLEVMSLLNLVSRSVDILRRSSKVFQAHPELCAAVSDLEKFVSSFSEAFESAPHIYLSALPWLPERSCTYTNAATSFRHLPLITGKDDDWRASIWTKAVVSDVHCVAYSPDGESIVSGSSDGTVRVWNSHTGAAVGEPLQGHEDSVLSVALSPDGRRIVSGSSDSTIRVWDADTGAPVGEPLQGDDGAVTSVAFSPDGRRIVSGFLHNTIRVWDTDTGAPIGEPFRGHENSVWSVAFLPDGRRIVSGSEDNSIRVWDTDTGVPVGKPLRGHEGAVNSVASSPDGRRIISGSEDNTIRVWDTDAGVPVGEPLRGHENFVYSVAFSADGRRIVSGSEDNTIRVWDTDTGAPVGEPLRGHEYSVRSIAFSPDGRRIVSGSEDKTIRVWDAHTGAPVGESLEGHEGAVRSIAFSPDGRRIVSGSEDKTIRVWDAHTGAPVGESLEGHEEDIYSVAFSADGRRIVSGSQDNTIRVWDTDAGVPVGEPLRGHELFVHSVAFSADGRRIVSGSGDKTIRVWDTDTGVPVGEPLRGHENFVYSVAFSADGRRIVSGSGDKTIRVWDTDTGASVGEPLRGHEGSVTSVAFSADGRRIVSGSEDKTIRVWDAHTGAPVVEPLRGHKGAVTSVASSPNGRRIVSGSADKTIRVWDTDAGVPVGEPLRGHENFVYSVAFSADGRRIVSGSEDNTIRVWGAHTGVDTEEMHDDADAETSSARGYHDRWITCRSLMGESDAWVRDEEKLLLWIPYRYRHLYRNLTVLVIGIGGGRTPDVALDKLYAYSGARWTGIYV